MTGQIKNKAFLVTLGKFVIGEDVKASIRGTPAQVKVTSEVLLASRALHEELKRPDATVSSIMCLLHAKHEAARAFEHVTMNKWPL